MHSRFSTRAAAAAILLSASAGGLADNHGESSINRIEPGDFGIDQQEIASIREQMQAAVDGNHIPGALLMVGNNDGAGMLETVGTQGPEDSAPVDEQTIFRIYSMTKPIVSVATMSMVEDELISVDDPVGDYIPAFNDMQVIDPETGETSPARNTMTVEHLLTHQSGLIQAIFSPDSELGRMYQQQIPGDGSITARETAQRLGGLPLYFEPGTAWHYGRSTDVLGAVLEVAADQTLDRILEERIFAPLGMDDTSFFVPESEASRIAEPIHGRMSNNTEVRAFLSGGGGLNSTTEDYARFAAMLLNDGRYEGKQIITESTLELMTGERITEEVSREYFFYGDRGNWSMGFHLQPIPNAGDAYNFGWRGIGGTLFLVDPVNDFYMIYMEQKRGGPQGAPFNNSTAQQVVYDAIID